MMGKHKDLSQSWLQIRKKQKLYCSVSGWQEATTANGNDITLWGNHVGLLFKSLKVKVLQKLTKGKPKHLDCPLVPDCKIVLTPCFWLINVCYDVIMRSCRHSCRYFGFSFVQRGNLCGHVLAVEKTFLIVLFFSCFEISVFFSGRQHNHVCN